MILVVSPDHRLFILSAADVLGAGRAEVRCARGKSGQCNDRPTASPGGFVDSFQNPPCSSRTKIIYAEGIAAETLLLDRARDRAAVGSVGKAGRHAGKLHARTLRISRLKSGLLDMPNAADILPAPPG